MGNRLGAGAGAAPNPNDPNPEVAWWCKLLARGVSTVGGAMCAGLGIWTAIGISAKCIAAGILQILVGMVVVAFESPCCCQFIEFARPLGDFAERRTFLQKAIFYGLIALIPIAICFGFGSLFGGGLVFAGAVIYGLMALGKKADQSEMKSRVDANNDQRDLVADQP